MSSDAIAVGDPNRALIGRAAFGALTASAVFFLFALTKQIRPIYSHAPWESDPYDAVLSFTMFFVPLIAGFMLVQVSLCRKAEPLSLARVAVILRACRVAAAAIVLELGSAWVAVALGANRSQWSTAASALLISLLVLSTVVTARLIVDLRRAPRFRVPVARSDASPSDWLADLILVAARESRWLGPLRRRALIVLGWVDEILVSALRRHPVVGATLASAGFGVTVLGYQGAREGYAVPVTLIAMGVGAAGMFAFLVVSGSYLGVVRSATPLHGLRRRALDACVVGCVAAIAALAFRDSLWWILASSPSGAGPMQLATLVGSAGVLAFAAALIAEELRERRRGGAAASRHAFSGEDHLKR